MAILTLDDWRYYPKAKIQLNTKNHYFYNLAMKFKAKGIRHWYMVLALLQPELEGIDPRSPNLDKITKIKILNEIKENPWYYFREVYRDESLGPNDEDQLFIASRGNVAMIWSVFMNLDVFNTQPRQTGKSYGIDALTDYLMDFVYEDTTINIFTKDNTLRVSNINRLKKIRSYLPDWLSPKTKKDDDNQSTMSCLKHRNKLFTHVYQVNEKAATKLGRGLTSPFNVFDELPFGEFVEETLSAASGSMSAAIKVARAKGVPYSMIITTTAGNKETTAGKYCFRLWQDATPWNDSFYDGNSREHARQLVINGGKSKLAPMVNITLNHRQLGYSDDWLEERRERAKGDIDNFARDFLNQWTSSDSKSLFTEAIASAIRAGVTEPLKTEITDQNYTLSWYEEYNPNEHYVLSVDSSNTIGRDYLANVLVNVRTGNVACVMGIQETNLHVYSGWLEDFLLKRDNITFIPENKINMQVIIDRLIIAFINKGINPYTRIFSYVFEDKEKHKQTLKVIRSANMRSPEFQKGRPLMGFSTTGSTRPFLFDTVMYSAVKRNPSALLDNTLVHQLLNLEKVNGKVNHRYGEHDDYVIAWLIACWFLEYSKNHSQYGINPSIVLKDAYPKKTLQETIDDAAMFADDQHRDYLKKQLDTLYHQLDHANEPWQIEQLERQIELLQLRMPKDSNEFKSIELSRDENKPKPTQQNKNTADRYRDLIGLL